MQWADIPEEDAAAFLRRMSAVLELPLAEGEAPEAEDVPPCRDLISLSILRAFKKVRKVRLHRRAYQAGTCLIHDAL